MENKVLLKVIEEEDCLHFQFEGVRSELFSCIEALVEALHYEDVKNGDCVIDSKFLIEYEVRKALRNGFEKAHTKLLEEVKKNENDSN